jgi:L-ascorbate metabolism protein UlaG (beta-lactamase superfamily)
MKITWYGHAAFKVTTEAGTRIILDPYESGAFDGALSYGKIADEADIVITSHDHADHNDTKDIKGSFTLIKQPGDYTVKDAKIKTIPTYHDPSQGKERGNNLISLIEVDGLKLAHMGDLGHELESDTLKTLGKVDILLLPVGGFFTIDPAQAARITNALTPTFTLPMHYKTDKCAFPIAPVEDFTKSFKSVRTIKGSELEIKKADLPANAEIILLQPAR